LNGKRRILFQHFMVPHSLYTGQTSYPVYESIDKSFISSYWRE